jgi:adenylylsulfate kinase
MQQANRERGAVIWFTGLSGSGKTTIAQVVEDRLVDAGVPVETLDGDIVRENLSKGLGFSKQDRDINIRRIAFVAHLLQRNGVFVITAAISPYRAVRDEARAMIKDFVEVFADAPIEVCEQRDVKGLYAKARAGEIKGFTGVDDPYEPPTSPEVVCRTDRESVEGSAQKVLDKLVELKYLEA